MKRIIYLFQIMLLATMTTSCDDDQLKNATDVILSPVYNLHTNIDGTIFTDSDGNSITNIYVYTEQPKVSESQSSLDAYMQVYVMEDFVDYTDDEYYDFSFTRVETLYEEDEDGNEYASGEERLTYVVWGYRDRTPYLLWGDDTPDDYSDDVYTRGELYVKVYNEDGEYLYGSQTQEDDTTTNKTNFASNGLKIFEEYRTIDSGK